MSEKVIENLPYAIVGHTAIPEPKISILFTAEGIKAIADKIGDGDMVRITVWNDVSNCCEKKACYSEITIIQDDEDVKP